MRVNKKRSITQAGYKNYSCPLQWNPEADRSFVEVKTSLSRACALNAPDYSQPFHLDVDEKDGFVNAVLYQKGEEGRSLDRKNIDVHGVKAFLDSNAFTLSVHRIQGLRQLLDKPHVHFTSSGANMATQMDTKQDHDCATETTREMQIHPNVNKEPLPEPPWMTLYCDGHSHHTPTGALVTSYAVVQDTPTGIKTVKTGLLTQPASAQVRISSFDRSMQTSERSNSKHLY